MALAEQTIRFKGQTYNVRVVPGSVSGPRHSIRWEADRIDATTGAVLETIYGDHDNFQDTAQWDNRIQGLVASGVARLRQR